MGKEFKEKKKKLMVSYAKQEIIDAVIKLIDQKGVRELTMSKVAEQVGVAKGTLYLYFDNKDDLIESAIHTSLEPLFMTQEEIIESDLQPDKKLEKLADFHLSFFAEHRNYFRVLIYEHQRSRDPKKRFIDTKYQHFLKRIGTIIQDGIDQGIFRPMDAELISVMFSESLVGVTLQSILREEQCDLDEVKNEIIEVFFNGLKAEST